jgi:clan AA aspartic protease
MEKITLTNSYDEEKVRSSGYWRPEEVRSIEVDALVDTGAMTLVLPADVVENLGLREAGRRKVRYANGDVAEIPWVAGVRLTVLGRETVTTALVEKAGKTPRIGQIPLEELDLLVDPTSRALRVNPDSPDAPLLDLLAAASRDASGTPAPR